MLTRREFLHMLAVAAAAGGLKSSISSAQAAAGMMYDPPRFGNLSLLHMGDTHGQLQPSYLREASYHLGFGEAANHPPFLVGEHFLEHFRVFPQSLKAHAHTALYFEDLARVYGKTGGYAALATVVRQLRASRPESLLLDCGDAWVGSALSLWTGAKEMVEASRLLGVDAMTGDWEFALGVDRLERAFGHELNGAPQMLGFNLRCERQASVPVSPYGIYFVNGTPVGVVGLAYPKIGRASARGFGHDWQAEWDEASLVQAIAAVRAKGVRCVVLLSHAGLAVDLKIATRVEGIDVILSGHSHDALPEPIVVRGRGGRTLVSSVGSHGKFLGVLDLDLRNGRVRDYRFHLVPVFANLVPADPAMKAMINAARAPHAAALDEVVARNEVLLYRRGTFGSSMDTLVLDALRAADDAEIGFAPGYRWGETVLPGDPIRLEQVAGAVAVPGAQSRSAIMRGDEIHQALETWADEVFHPDPYARSGEDMVRVSGLMYRCDPAAPFGWRIRDVEVNGVPLESGRQYRVVSWGLEGLAQKRSPDQEPNESSARTGGAGDSVLWARVATHLRDIKVVQALPRYLPKVVGVEGNRGVFEAG